MRRVEEWDEVDEVLSSGPVGLPTTACPSRLRLIELALECGEQDDPLYEHLEGCGSCYHAWRRAMLWSAASLSAVDERL